MAAPARALLAALVLAGAGAAPCALAAGLSGETRHAFTIVAQPLPELLDAFASNFGVAVAVDRRIEGEVRNLHGTFSAVEFLDAVAERSGIDWYFDGTTVHVSPASGRRSVIVDFGRVSPDALDQALSSLGLVDPRFPVRRSADGRIGVVTAPPRYVELIENAFALLQGRPAPPEPQPGARVAPATRILIVRGDSAQVWAGKNAVPDGEVPAPDTGEAPDDAAGAPGQAAAP
jgi:type III secretion protein C